ncbi:hypothetical protein G7Y79_00032g066500 [Physcia stellaris]|nr:hypothetical protein G7Y79_00032g066500 [Physcia stellaris]
MLAYSRLTQVQNSSIPSSSLFILNKTRHNLSNSLHSTIAPFFEKLHRELRDQIYGELLADKVHHIEPQGKRYGDRASRKRLSPVIFRVCRQAYIEASIVLYENNIFRYNVPRPKTDEILDEYRSREPRSGDRWRLNPLGLDGEVLKDDDQDSDKDSDDSDSLWSDGSENPVLHIGSLERIKHLEIHYEGDIPDLMGSPDPVYGGGPDGKTVCLTLEKFVNHGGALNNARNSYSYC